MVTKLEPKIWVWNFWFLILYKITVISIIRALKETEIIFLNFWRLSLLFLSSLWSFWCSSVKTMQIGHGLVDTKTFFSSPMLFFTSSTSTFDNCSMIKFSGYWMMQILQTRSEITSQLMSNMSSVISCPLRYKSSFDIVLYDA